ncbi:glycerate kinase [Suttonella indologenes]|uniref:Glycerate kinase n=1 Tax=Suttonella indologenes TaxID=13276 RepID=A0A380MK23_9GAMM|nr:glycerate kinase [Suttonella indologenes]SUO91353.1 Glycerate kinase [Suttonella indologenes]
MKIVIAPDSFKESLTALAVAEAIGEGFRRILPQAQYRLVPMADGGEGLVQSIVDATQGEKFSTQVTAPLGNKVSASWGMTGDGQSAVIEMAEASGLHLVPTDKRNPLISTSYGTGELISTALDKGLRRIILGIGGSATNDGGVGMLQALGAKFVDKTGKSLSFGGAALADLAQIDMSGLDPRLQETRIEVACDVDNPLCGEHGASAVFGAQKGATKADIQRLDAALRHFAEQVQAQLGIDIQTPKGAGAAGGMGGGLMLLPQVRLRSGVQMVIEAVDLAAAIADADIVVTGEGRMDGQSVHGKTPIGVAKLAKSAGKPVIAIVGSLREDYPAVYEAGIDAVFPIIRQINSLENTLQAGRENLISTAENVARLWQIAGKNALRAD